MAVVVRFQMPLRTPCFNKYVVGAKIRTISDIPKYFLCFYRLIANYSLIGDSFIQLKNISDSCNDTVQMLAASRMAIFFVYVCQTDIALYTYLPMTVKPIANTWS